MRFAATAALLAFLALPVLADPPDAAAVDGWIRGLSDDDAGKRDEAEKRLSDVGEPVIERLKALLVKGENDPEAQTRMRRLVEKFEHAKTWEKTWTENPIEIAKDYVKDRRCGTCRQDRVPFNVVQLKHDALEKRFPDLRFFALDWVCCEDKPTATIVLAVGRAADVLIEIGNDLTWSARLAPYVPVVKMPEDARETGSLLACLSEQPARFDEKVILDATRGDVEGKDGAFTVSVPFHGRKGGAGWIVNFDKDGKLQGVGVIAR